MTRTRRRGATALNAEAASGGALETLSGLINRFSMQRGAGTRLGRSPAVGAQAAWSDLDLMLLFTGLALAFARIRTTVSGMLTEIVCCAVGDFRAVARGASPDHWGRDTLIRFLGGRIPFDGDGVVERAAQWAADQPVSGPDEDPYLGWRHARYNVRQTRRYLASGDEAARTAVAARTLYSLRDCFAVRSKASPGDKEAVAHLRTKDPDLFSARSAAVAETDIARKVVAWEALFPRFTHHRCLCSPDVELVQPVSGVGPEREVSAWRKLTQPGAQVRFELPSFSFYAYMSCKRG